MTDTNHKRHTQLDTKNIIHFQAVTMISQFYFHNITFVLSSQLPTPNAYVYTYALLNTNKQIIIHIINILVLLKVHTQVLR